MRPTGQAAGPLRAAAGRPEAGSSAVTGSRRLAPPGKTCPAIPPGLIEQAGRAGTEASQLHWARDDRRRSTMRRDSPPARQMPGDHDHQHGESHDRCQPPPPPAGLTVPALAQDVIHNPHRLKQPTPAQGPYFGKPGAYSGAERRLGPPAPRSVTATIPAANTPHAQSAPPRSCGGRAGQIHGVVQDPASAPSVTSQ